MKIRADVKQDGCKVAVKILDTIFEDGEERGDSKGCYSKDGKFRLYSARYPELCCNCLYVWGMESEHDTDEAHGIYDTEEEATKVVNYIKEFMVEDKPKIAQEDKMGETQPDNAWKIQTDVDKQIVKINLFIVQLENYLRTLTKTQQDTLMSKVNEIRQPKTKKTNQKKGRK